MSHVRRMAYLLIALLGGALVVSGMWKPAPAPRYNALRPADVPCRVGDYRTCRDYDLGENVRATLSTGEIISRYYGEGPDMVDFVLIGGRDRDAMHDPRLCLTGAGWKLGGSHVERLPGTNVAARAYQTYGIPGARGYDVMYFYVTDGQIFNEYAQVRRRMFWSELFGQKSHPIYFFRFVQTCGPDAQTTASHHTRMVRFAAQIWTALAPKLPGLPGTPARGVNASAPPRQTTQPTTSTVQAAPV